VLSLLARTQPWGKKGSEEGERFCPQIRLHSFIGFAQLLVSSKCWFVQIMILEDIDL
jgi:hypothetical protein